MAFKYSLCEILLGVTSVALFPAAYILIDLQQDLPSWCFADTCIDAKRSMQPLVRKDLAIFYILLFLTATIIVLARKSTAISHFFSKRVFKTSSITVAELGWFSILLVTLAMSFGWNINYWWFRRLKNWTKVGKPLSTLVPQTLFNASGDVLSVILGLCLYAIDGFTRFSFRFSPDSVSTVSFEECGYITVTVSTPKARNACPGQFMRVNVPSVSQLEFHPWSIVRATDTSVTFLFGGGHIDREWSAKVAEKLKQFDKSSKIAVNLQGPYGKAIEVTRKTQDLVLFYVGGTGIAASIQAIDGVLARNNFDVDDAGKTKVVLAWSARRENMAAISLLQPWKNVSCDVLELEFFQTNGNLEVDTKTPAEELRMNLTSKLKKHASFESKNTELNVGVFICGPPEFTKDALRSVSAFVSENPKVSLEVEVESFDV
ncbi:hypothetical protein HK100_007072 [Physocladia obscura]|uniref:FAD-binding 8 domain-containing protein n=1 Tax=Physocladia obscura TaxID=109957 RepID=A0AAD5SPN6_9FUNG|nr:hypothetical protein HK100_007072 [Physocladia obscura]